LNHPPGFNKPNSGQKLVAIGLIREISFDKALEYKLRTTIMDARDIPPQKRNGKSKYYCASFRLDFQGRDNGKPIERLATQYTEDKKQYHFAQIHIEIGPVFGIFRFIRWIKGRLVEKINKIIIEIHPWTKLSLVD
jgi:hypothetical protein